MLRLLLVLLAVSLPVSLGLVYGPRSSAGEDYTPWDPSFTLVWSEEFNQTDGATPDAAVWTHETGGSGEGNDELEFYTARSNNSYIQDGRLVIQALQEKYQGHNYTSGRINSAGKVEVLYGLIAARVRIDMYDGYWPAFWLLGSMRGVGWPRCGEMDIMEQVNGQGTGGQDDSLQFGTLHYNQYGENNTKVNHEMTGTTIKQKAGHYWGSEFHLYQALWTNTTYTFLVDDLAYLTIDLTSDVKYNSFIDRNNPFYFIVNLAMGGDFPKRVPQAGFPAHFIVDWIRVWQQPGVGFVRVAGKELVAQQQQAAPAAGGGAHQGAPADGSVVHQPGE